MEQNFLSDQISSVEIDHNSRDHLKTITTWSRIIAIVAFINVGISFLAIFTGPETSGLALAVFIPIMLIYAAVIIILNYFLLRFSNHTSASLDTQNQQQFNSGIKALRIYFMILGILLIIVLVFMFFGFLAAMAGVFLGRQ